MNKIYFFLIYVSFSSLLENEAQRMCRNLAAEMCEVCRQATGANAKRTGKNATFSNQTCTNFYCNQKIKSIENEKK